MRAGVLHIGRHERPGERTGGLSMADEMTRVDVLSLEDFRRTLDIRLIEAQNLLTHLTDTIPAHPPLGGFFDANDTAAEHASRHSTQVVKVRRLVSAIKAAQAATDTIIDNYTTTEARNNANSADIAGVLGGVSAALDGSSDG